MSDNIYIYPAYHVGGMPVAIHSNDDLLDANGNYVGRIEGNTITITRHGAANFFVENGAVYGGCQVVFTLRGDNQAIMDGVGSDYFLMTNEPDEMGLAAAACYLRNADCFRNPTQTNLHITDDLLHGAGVEDCHSPYDSEPFRGEVEEKGKKKEKKE
jgi:hypothetical protein